MIQSDESVWSRGAAEGTVPQRLPAQWSSSGASCCALCDNDEWLRAWAGWVWAQASARPQFCPQSV